MHLSTRTWYGISIFCLVAAIVCWRLGNQRVEREANNPPLSTNTAVTKTNAQLTRPATRPSAFVPSPTPPLVRTEPKSSTTATNADPFRYRLSNTPQSLDQLLRRESAILLRNALFDTATGTDLPIPAALRATGDPGSYIVQARGQITDKFRAYLIAAGAQIISYVPNNAYLVRMSAAGADQMSRVALTQSVLPWEPYYKLDTPLLALAVENKPLPEGTLLNVMLFPDAALPDLGLPVLLEERSPFGKVVTVRAQPESLTALAQLPEVQSLEIRRQRVPANDLSRIRTGVTVDGKGATQNYLHLTGNGVLVNINDTGVDAEHPDLEGRITGDTPNALTDPEGHGTHVAGTILSSGAHSPSGAIPGSTNNANFRGLAPSAKAYVMSVDLFGGPIVSDSYLQQNAVLNNADIVNNSWNYAGAQVYDFAAASYDAAVRDSLPGTIGSQPLPYVFSAGNEGGGDDAGLNGAPGSISSPGTAKNVITVGAIESFRNITNKTAAGNQTNQFFLAETDSNNQVASFSSRGNVGLGVEGSYGRFKPDLVAPGVFIVSTRASGWTSPTVQLSQASVVNLNNQATPGGGFFLGSFSVPQGGYQAHIRILTNAQSPFPFPGLLLTVNKDTPPPPALASSQNNDLVFNVTAGTWFYAVANNTPDTVTYNLQLIVISTNNATYQLQELAKLNAGLNQYYRYESGTSMSAAVVSGVLALLEEFFEQQKFRTNSPALMKALLINGARSLSQDYDFATAGYVNYQGWGLVNLTNSLPSAMATKPESAWPSILIDQNPATALATGQTHRRRLTVSPQANTTNAPLRLTLAWTDPPGNPAVGVKLVNDLDLLVTQTLSLTNTNGTVTVTNYHVGNNFTPGTVFTDPATSLLTTTNATGVDTVRDRVNNVENVFIENPVAGATYEVSVIAQRVHVNAVTAHTNGIVQDYALVISYGNQTASSPLSLSDQGIGTDPSARVIVLTNSIPLLNQRVGASSPLLTPTGIGNGMTNQWNFYVFNNTGSTNTNVAFVTFMPPNLARPRTSEADIDLYVSTDPNLTNLDAAVLADPATWRSVGRGGTESVVLEGVAPDQTYYLGVKSEDQQAAEFSIFAYAGSAPFNNSDTNGNVTLFGVPVPLPIPDGSPDQPEGALLFAFGTRPITLQNVVVTNTLTHEFGGDLFGQLSHDGQNAVLNNHRGFNGIATFIYDDSDSGNIILSEPSDGPSTLRNFVGGEGLGVWMLTMIDNSLFHTGQVEQLTIFLERRQDPKLFGPTGISTAIQPNRWFYTAVDVPTDATNLQVCLDPQGAPVNLYVRFEAFPDLTNFTKFVIAPPSVITCLDLSRFDSPPLAAGRYFIGIYNPNTVPVKVDGIKVNIGRDLRPAFTLTYGSGGRIPILDDAVTNSVIHVTNAQMIADIMVGVRLKHDRASDLVLHLISPQGTRILLAENRGGYSPDGYGAGTLTTNVFPQQSNGDWHAVTNTIPSTTSEGVISITYDFYTIPDRMTIYYEGVQIFDTGLISGSGSFEVAYGPGSSTNVDIVMNEGGNPNLSTAWTYTATVLSGSYLYTTFTENTNLTTTPIKFGMAPFTNSTVIPNLGVPVFISGFEGVIPTNYSAGQTVDGWTVDANQVEVINDPALAHTGVNFLALVNGRISRELTTIPGAVYRLTYAFRDPGIVSWWPGESNAVVKDIIGSNNGQLLDGATYGAGLVGQALAFDGGDAAMECARIPYSPQLVSPKYTLETWVEQTTPITNKNNEALVFGQNRGQQLVLRPGTFGLNPGFRNYTSNGLTNVWSETFSTYEIPIGAMTHLASTWDGATQRLYVNGLLSLEDTPSQSFLNSQCSFFIGGIVELNIPSCGFSTGWFLTGLVDEPAFYNRALTPLEISAIYNAGSAGKCTPVSCRPNAKVMVQGLSHIVVANSAWQTNTILFTASATNTPVALVGNPLSVLFDTFELTPIRGPAYYLPEEPLSPLIGQSAFGDWKLEIWDDRAGGNLPNSFPELLSWDLQISFINTNPPAVTLTNGQCYTAILAGGHSAFFVVDVPLVAVIATNSLTASGPVNFFYNPNGLPVGDLTIDTGGLNGNPADDVALLVNAVGGEVLIATGGTLINGTNQLATPTLQPGGTYYLAVQNTNASGSNTFTLCLGFNATDTNFLSVIPLTNGVAYKNCPSLPIAPGPLLQYYHFDVATNAYEVSFTVHPLNPGGDVNLVVRRGLPLPNSTSYDFHSINPGTNDEQIVVDDFTFTQLPGRWYIGVYNVDTNSVCYEITATQLGGQVPIILTVGTPVTNNIATNSLDFYKVIVDTNVYRVDFILTNLTGNVDLYVGQTPPVTPLSADMASVNPGLATEVVSVDTNSFFLPGTWYLTVNNADTVPVTYTVLVIEYTNVPVTIVTLTNDVPFTNNVVSTNGPIGDGIDYYAVTISSNAVWATFDVFAMSTNVDLVVSYGLPLPTLSSNTYFSANSGTNAEEVLVTTNSLPVPLQPGIWYLGVTHLGVSTSNLSYVVLVTEHTNPPPIIVTLTNAVPFTNTVAATNGVDYYRVTISSNALEAHFEILNPSGNVDLYVKPGLPLPAMNLFAYASTNAGAANEFIAIATNSAPVPLRPGDWYLAVANQASNSVTYTVRVTEFTLGTNIIPLTNSVPFTNNVASTNGPVLDGIDYYVFTVASNATWIVFDVLNMNANVDLVVHHGPPLPTLLNYDYLSANVGATPEEIVVITNSVPMPLTPGVWYIGVVHSGIAGTNLTYVVQVTQFTNAPPLVSTLNNDAPMTLVLPPPPLVPPPPPEVSPPPIQPGQMAFFSFTVSSNAVQANFEILNPSGNVDLYIKPGTLFVNPDAAAYASTNGGTANEFIAVATNTTPIPLTPGLWYLAVVNRDTNAVTYTVRVTQFVPGTPQLVQLTNGLAFTNTVVTTNPPVADGTDYYVYTVTANATWATFEVLRPNASVDLVLRRGLPLPTVTSFDYRSANPGTLNEQILVITNSSPVPLTPGNWYLGVTHYGLATSNLTYAVRVNEFTNTPPAIPLLANAVPFTNTVAASIGVDYYRFNVSTGAVEAHFEILQPSGNVDLFIRPGSSLPGPLNYAYAGTNNGTANEFVAVATNSAPVPLTPGEWSLAVTNRETNAVTYVVRVTEYVPGTPPLVKLTNGVAFARNVPTTNGPFDNGIDYYVFTVSTNARWVTFDAFAMNANVDLVVRHSVPLPTLTNFDYRSVNSGTNVEQVIVITNSMLVPLTAGNWYLGVTHFGLATTNLTYAVRATEFTSAPPVIVTLNNTVAFTNTVPLAATQFYKFAVSSNAVQANFEILKLSGNVNLYLKPGLPLPSSSLFAYAGTHGGTANEFIAVALNSAPTPLVPGDWYLAVVNTDVTNVAYTVRATEFVPGTPTLVRLTNALAFTNRITSKIGPVGDGIDYYVFRVSSNSVWTTFDVFAMNANVNLLVRRDLPLPTLTGFDYGSFNPGRNDEEVWVVTNSQPVALAPGDWYLGVTRAGLSVNSLTYAVRATESTNLPPVVTRLVSATDHTITLAGGSTQYFRFAVSTNALQANFELFNLTGNADLFVKPGLPLPSALVFAYASTNKGTNDEFVGVATNSLPTALQAGDWYLAVINQDPANVTCTVRATEFFLAPTSIVTLANAVPYTNLVFASASQYPKSIDYYVFQVASNATWVSFNLQRATTNFDLLARHTLTLPRPYNFDFRNANPGTEDEQILVLTNSKPVALTPGAWFIGVTHFGVDPNNESYVLTAAEFTNAPPPLWTLTNGVAFTNTIAGGSVTQYYKLTVQTNAIQADFEILSTSGRVDLFVRPWLPLANFTYASATSGVTNVFVHVATNSPPIPLAPGDWYLAVANLETTNVTYAVRATAYPPLVPLTNGVAHTNTLVSKNGVVPDDLDYYVYHVTPQAAWALFEVLAPSADVDLLVTRGLPFPTQFTYDYSSVNPGTLNEQVLVITNSTPVALAPGDWYLSVAHFGLNVSNLSYAVRATEFTSAPPVFTTLANHAAFTNTVATGTNGVDYYVFNISTNAVEAHFEILNPSGNVDLFVRPGLALPGPLDYSWLGTNGGAANEFIAVATNSEPVPLTPGLWSLAVLNRDASAVTYEVRVTEYVPGTPQLVPLFDGAPYVRQIAATNGPSQGIDYYLFEVPADATWATFDVRHPNADVALFARLLTPLPTPANYDYFSDNPGINDEGILVTMDSSPVPLAPGAWFLGVVYLNPSTNSVAYTIVATTFTSLPPVITEISNGVAFVNPPDFSTDAVDYYTFTVSTNAVRAQFEVLHPDSDVTLLARQGLPLPDLSDYNYLSANNGLSDELIVVFNYSRPVPLSPGAWYLGVVKLATNAVNYEIKFTEFAEYGTNLLITRIVPSTNELCLTWTNAVPGVNYHIEARTSLNTPLWFAASPTIIATNHEMTYCLPLPTPFMIFRIAEGLGPASVNPPVAFSTVGISSNGLSVAWQAPPDYKFGVEWSAALSGPWNAFTNVVTGTAGRYKFTDDGTQSGGRSSMRFYRITTVP